jgi:phospholipase/carboxylesterase
MIDTGRFERALARGGDAIRELAADRPPELDAVRDAVLAMLDGLAVDMALPPERLVLGGFSQGAMLSTELALALAARGTPPAGLLLLSGTVIAEPMWRKQLAATPLTGLPTLIAHGRQDPLLPFGQAEALRDLLTAGGAAVRFVPFDGGHEIPPPVLAAARTFLRETLPAKPQA